ncbi:MAG TPA: DUF3052 domain-containing protein [Actinomycetota bacterium]|nr:DUF3052 domain-containing protein [Actinomycetota bacterium]
MTGKDYSGTPLPKKLGIREGHAVVFVSAPPGFEKLLDPLPPGTEIRDRARGPLDVVVLFATRRSELERRFGALARSLDPAGGLWVAWPKKSAGIENDLSFEVVQRIGLDTGLVDNKSASIDAGWQGLRFVVRKEDRPAWPIVLKPPTRA